MKIFSKAKFSFFSSLTKKRWILSLFFSVLLIGGLLLGFLMSLTTRPLKKTLDSSSLISLHRVRPLTSTQQQRVHKLSQQFRCPVCGGQAVSESNVEEAEKIIKLIKEWVFKGYGDRQIKEELVRLYGISILLDPPLQPLTYILWSAPLFCALIGLFFVYRRTLAASYTQNP